MRTALALCFVLITSAGSIQAEDKPIDELKIDKVGLDTSLQEFLKMHPEAKRVKQGDDKYGMKTYAISDKEADCISVFSFLDNKLALMFVQWGNKGLQDSGGVGPILKKLVSKYGKADADSPGSDGKKSTLKWVSPTTSNIMLVMLDDTGLQIGLTSMELHKQLNELKAKQAKRKIDD